MTINNRDGNRIHINGKRCACSTNGLVVCVIQERHRRTGWIQSTLTGGTGQNGARMMDNILPMWSGYLYACIMALLSSKRRLNPWETQTIMTCHRRSISIASLTNITRRRGVKLPKLSASKRPAATEPTWIHTWTRLQVTSVQAVKPYPNTPYW